MLGKQVWRFGVQNSVVVEQNSGKGKTKKRATRAYLFFAN